MKDPDDDNGNPSHLFPAQTRVSNIDIDFYYSQKNLSRNDWRTLESPISKSEAFHVTDFSKPSDASEECADFVTFMVFVENEPGNYRFGSSYNMIVNIHFTKSAAQVNSPPAKVKYDLGNIQGDVIIGLPKALEYFYFFQIYNLDHFRRIMKSFVLPKLTTAEKLISMSSSLPPSGLSKPGTNFIGFNVGFSAMGLTELGLTEDLHDEAFHRGQFRDAKDLGDQGTMSNGTFTPEWDAEFRQTCHGIFQITAHDESNAILFVRQLETAFSFMSSNPIIKKTILQHSHFRPPPQTPNEHFGYRDGISKPEVEGVTFDEKRPMRFKGSPVVDMGVIVMGHEGDENREYRPDWAVDGSFFVFRKLKCYVPEFQDFLRKESPRIFPNISKEKAVERLGSRLFGRWKSGTPIVLSPNEDDPAIAKDNDRLNNFDYNVTDQAKCPFSAHTRKSFARSDINTSKKHLFRRQGIPYGPEMGSDEGHHTIQDRGLIFTAYQSSIVRGFKFIQTSAFNSANFPPAKSVQPGYDPIVGSTGGDKRSKHRFMSGANPTAQHEKLNFPVQFVEARGGEYFFVPSMETIRKRIGV